MKQRQGNAQCGDHKANEYTVAKCFVVDEVGDRLRHDGTLALAVNHDVVGQHPTSSLRKHPRDLTVCMIG